MKRIRMKTLFIAGVTLFCISVLGFFQDSYNVVENLQISSAVIIFSMGGAIAAMAGYIVLLFKSRVEIDRMYAEKVERISSSHVMKIEELMENNAERMEKIISSNRDVLDKVSSHMVDMNNSITMNRKLLEQIFAKL